MAKKLSLKIAFDKGKCGKDCMFLLKAHEMKCLLFEEYLECDELHGGALRIYRCTQCKQLKET